MRRYRNKPKLELLESRVLLSAVDTPASSSTGNDWQTAIQANGSDVSVDLLPFSQVLKISGSGHGSVSVDLSKLPDSVINLQISSFDSVTFTGEHKVDALTVSDVHQIDAGHISIGSTLWLNNVERARIDTAPVYIWIQGQRGGDQVSVADKTLIEVNDFSADVNSTIFAYVKNLGLSAQNHSTHLPAVIGGGVESIMLNFQPTHALLGSGVPAEATVIKGDFARYFLASPSERIALEQSLLITRQAALIERVPLATLLNNNPRLQATLGDSLEAGQIKATLRPLNDKLIDPIRVDSNLSQVTRQLSETLADGSHPSAASNSGLDRILHVESAAAAVPVTSGEAAHATADFAAHGAVDDPGFNLHNSAPAHTEAVATALSLALARMGDSFGQTLSALQGHTATFGQLAAAQVTGNLRVESRPALLVDARTSRQQRDDQAIVVVQI